MFLNCTKLTGTIKLINPSSLVETWRGLNCLSAITSINQLVNDVSMIENMSNAFENTNINNFIELSDLNNLTTVNNTFSNTSFKCTANTIKLPETVVSATEFFKNTQILITNNQLITLNLDLSNNTNIQNMDAFFNNIYGRNINIEFPSILSSLNNMFSNAYIFEITSNINTLTNISDMAFAYNNCFVLQSNPLTLIPDWSNTTVTNANILNMFTNCAELPYDASISEILWEKPSADDFFGNTYINCFQGCKNY